MTEATTPEPSRKPRRWPWLVIVPVAVVLGFGGGLLLRPDPETVKVPTAATAHKETALTQKANTLSDRANDLDARAEVLRQRESSLNERKTSLNERADKLDQRADDIEQRENKLEERIETVEHNSIGTGTWTVGTDVESGTYRASDVSSSCYWEITKAGTNGGGIVQNGIPGGGNPTVTLSEGQVFSTQRCGEWHKQE